MILTSLARGFDVLQNHVSNEVGCLQVALFDRLDTIEQSVEFLVRLNSPSLTVQRVMTPLITLSARVKMFIKNLPDADPSVAVPEMSGQLFRWATCAGDGSCGPQFNGQEFYSAGWNNPTLMQQVFLPTPLGVGRHKLIFEGSAQDDQLLCALISCFPASSAHTAPLPNPQVWHLALENFVQLNGLPQYRKFDIDPDEQLLEEMLNTGETLRKHIDALPLDEDLWQDRINKYDEALQRVKDCYTEFERALTMFWTRSQNDTYSSNPHTTLHSQSPVAKLDYLGAPSTLIGYFKPGSGPNRLPRGIEVVNGSKVGGARLTVAKHLAPTLANALAPEILAEEYVK